MGVNEATWSETGYPFSCEYTDTQLSAAATTLTADLALGAFCDPPAGLAMASRARTFHGS